MSDPLTADYGDRHAARSRVAAVAEHRHVWLSRTRLALFAVALLLIPLFGWSAAPWLAVPLALFVPLLFVHAGVLNSRDRGRRAAAFYTAGLARLQNTWQGHGVQGTRYRDPQHLYAEDLDLFGSGSLFELLSTMRTRGGEDLLAAWLLAPANPETVRERQVAVQELAGQLDLRESLAVAGPELQQVVRTSELQEWALAPSTLVARWPALVLPVLATLTVTLVGLWIASGEPSTLLVPVLATQVVIALVYRHRAHHVAHGLEARAQELRVLATILARVMSEPTRSPRLQTLQRSLQVAGRSPVDEVKRLALLSDMLASGHNPIFAPLSALLLLGTQLAFAVERWRLRSAQAVPVWLAVVAEYEALSALATFAAEHPDYVFPHLVSDDVLVAAEALAHPLLPAAAMANDVQLGGGGAHLLLISGSNMSGKSTLLRAVGVNVVLAQAGAPVRARQLRLSPLRIGATLRIQDSLQEGRSRFFAEIRRLSEIVTIATEPRVPSSPGVLFLIDELLSGTNSHDRLRGATGILAALVERGAIGLATTHDLALTQLSGTLAQQGVNMHFADRLDGGGLTFDYRLQPGVVQTSNALALMRAVGLEV